MPENNIECKLYENNLQKRIISGKKSDILEIVKGLS